MLSSAEGSQGSPPGGKEESNSWGLVLGSLPGDGFHKPWFRSRGLCTGLDCVAPSVSSSRNIFASVKELSALSIEKVFQPLWECPASSW